MGLTPCTDPQFLYKGALYLYLHVSALSQAIIKYVNTKML